MERVILLVVIMLAIVGIGVGVMLFVVKRLTAKFDDNDESESQSITEAQAFLPFENISEGLIELSGHKYRAVMECSSVNYTLKTDGERELIEVSFQQFLNSLPCPITIYTQTKLIDNSRRQQMLESSIKGVVKDFPLMSAYAEQYKRDMANLTKSIGNSLQKKRYIIVPYDEVDTLGELSDEEKVHYAAREVQNRCNIIKANLDGVGVNSHILNTQELVELVYSAYHRDDFSFAEAIANGDAFALFVDGETDRFADRPEEADLDQVLAEAIKKVQMHGLSLSKEGEQVLDGLTDLRKKHAGYYKEGGPKDAQK